MFAVDSVNGSGGIALLWKSDINIRLLSYSKCYIDVVVNHGTCWRLTGVYGELDQHEREEFWDELKSIKNNCDLPWLCEGDFN